MTATLLLVAMSGCVGEEGTGPVTEEGPTEAVAVPRPVVVAVIDSGVDLYHRHFARDTSVGDDVLATLVNTLDDTAPERITLTTDGTHEERLEADKEVWGNMGEETLYYFEGTNVLGISFDDRDDHPVLDDGSHGTGTSAAVFNVDPDVLVVLVEGIGADAEAWAAAQPWIDVVSMSYGPIGSVPLTAGLFGLQTSEATKAMWQSGKVPVGAVDNTPALATFDETGGPPWVVGVAGDHPGGCREEISGNLPDFTSDFTQELPRSGTVDENRSMSGTSFAAPRTAGSFATVLRELRATYGAPPAAEAAGVLSYGPADDTVTNAVLREAFERAARYFGPSPTCLAGTVNPVAPWFQQGWGHVGPDVALDALAVITGAHDVPEKPSGAKEWNARHMELREFYWGSP